MAVQTKHVLDNVSVAAGGTEVSAWTSWGEARAIRVVVASAGANITVTLQGTVDGGTTVYDIATVAGTDSVRDLSDGLIRLKADNSGAGAESIDAWLILRS